MKYLNNIAQIVLKICIGKMLERIINHYIKIHTQLAAHQNGRKELY